MHGRQRLRLVMADVDHATGREDREVVPVARQDADLAVDRSGSDERRLAGEHFLLDRDDLDVELLVSHAHSFSSSAASALDVFDATAHEERLLGQVVVLALGELLERLDRLVERDERPVDAGECLGDEECSATGTAGCGGPG